MAVKRKPQAERLKAMKGALDAINKKAGKVVIGTANNEEIAEKLIIEYIPTASHKLNSAMGGGWPRGKFSLVSGLSDSGKTYRLLEDIGHNMKNDPDFIAAWFETESSVPDEALTMFGIDRKRFIYRESGLSSGEDVLDEVIRVAHAGVDMIVINSLKCLTPAKEFQDSMSDANVAIQARLNAKFMRVIVPTIAETGSALAIVQHYATDIGKMYGDNKSITGGLAIRYNNVLTVEYRKCTITSAHPLYSVKDDYMLIKAKITKNHCVTTRNPYTTTEYIVKLGDGTDVTSEIFDEAFNQEILHKSGAWIREYNAEGPQAKGNERTLPDGTLAQWNGMAKFTEYVNNNPDYFKYLEDRVSGSILVDNLSEEEIQEIKAIEQQEQELLENEIEKAMSEA